tara:strand:- start:9372 stop:9833 length:462 start_codon:yes stop_codon:yes gene_type:complete
MIKISKLADYSVVVLSAMSTHSHDVISASTLSHLTKLPEPTVSKVLKLLSKAKIIQSTRGTNGGYSLVKEPQRITMDSVISAIDGPIAITACTDGAQPDCSLGNSCSLRGRWDGVNAALRSALQTVTLADMLKISGAQTIKQTEIKDAIHGSH